MKNDLVNHPKHYTRENAMECIDEIRLVFGDEVAKGFCLGNIWKYRYRSADKNGAQDIAKSDWYVKKYKQIIDEQNGAFTPVEQKNDYLLTTDVPFTPLPMRYSTTRDPFTPEYLHDITCGTN